MIRAAVATDADALARVMIDGTQHAFRGRVPDRCLAWITPEESARNWRRTIETRLNESDTLLVAEDAGRVVGFCMAKAIDDEPGFDAELKNMGVEPSQQGKGIGRRLVTAAAGHLRRHNRESMLVRVLEANPNVGFYQKLGATLVRRELYDWNSVPLVTMVYGWTDLDKLGFPGTGPIWPGSG
jgi:ribosomal protein S18 acetylase RimI-like enzyme